ncbi:RNA polymerase sigma factor region1.1 domain-containing protein [Microvirga sp. HBU67558]|uniref:RNA polymerase sigma factor region1.1 domain-containing protein n=1 Tax=Microvirga TaxID=186650 RepID=UPI001B3990D3|nr:MULTISPECIES: RNA polymerase sigma factor region1.1 domain-containing protein [unclassified Microvirga]MBQ0819635.1 RNA polymerase sigma factor region1.1 domain-containing protein [Microvirga sp. HBU67558]
MQPALDSTTLDRLIALGREQGHLTNQDLEDNLPIASMSAEEIALIVVHLEETGVPVELDDSLASPNPKPSPAPVKSAEIIPFPDRAAAAKMKRRNAPLQKAGPTPSEATKTAWPSGRAAHWAVVISGLLVLVLLVGLVMMLGV